MPKRKENKESTEEQIGFWKKTVLGLLAIAFLTSILAIGTGRIPSFDKSWKERLARCQSLQKFAEALCYSQGALEFFEQQAREGQLNGKLHIRVSVDRDGVSLLNESFEFSPDDFSQLDMIENYLSSLDDNDNHIMIFSYIRNQVTIIKSNDLQLLLSSNKLAAYIPSRQESGSGYSYIADYVHFNAVSSVITMPKDYVFQETHAAESAFRRNEGLTVMNTFGLSQGQPSTSQSALTKLEMREFVNLFLSSEPNKETQDRITAWILAHPPSA